MSSGALKGSNPYSICIMTSPARSRTAIRQFFAAPNFFETDPRPAAFQAQIYRECTCGSAIAPALFDAAVTILPELAVDPYSHEHLGWPIHDALGWQPPSRNWQHRRPHRFQAGAAFLHESGEVWQVKPCNPRLDDRGKVIKYETGRGAGSRAYLPPVPPEVRDAIARRYGVPVPADGSFWSWLADRPDLPIVITEGAKKALSLLSQGYVAIALTGVYGGYRSRGANGDRLECPRLIEDLIPFLHRGRRILLAFDSDEKPNTRRKVAQAIARFSLLLRAEGCRVAIAQWSPQLGKGIDDVAVSQGQQIVQQLLNEALPFEDWLRDRRYRAIRAELANPLGRYAPTLTVELPDLTAIAPTSVPTTGTIALLSAMGTGKTKFIARLIQGRDRAIAPGHRESLQRGLGQRLGLDYLHDADVFRGQRIGIDGNPTKRLSLCWDSILALNPNDYPLGSYDLVIDEADQGFQHLISGSTCGKGGKRPKLLARAVEFIQNARRVILASAGLTDRELDLIAELRGEQPWILHNTYRANAYPCELATDSSHAPGSRKRARSYVLKQLQSSLEQGDRVWVAVDQLRTSKAIAQLGIELGLSADQILRYDSETSTEAAQRAFADAPDSWLSDRDIRLAIASPSLTSGISIEGDRFEKVFGFFEGQSTAPHDCDQALMRVRQPVPRIVFAAARGKGSDPIDATNPLDYRGRQWRRTELIAKVLSDENLRDRVDRDSPAARYHANAQADRNRAMGSFGQHLQARLELAGHEIKMVELTDDFEAIAERWKTLLDFVRRQEAIAIQQAAIIDEDEAQGLRDRRTLKIEDRLKLERFNIATFYRIAPEQLAIADVLKDAKGRTRRALTRLERLLWTNLALDGDRDRLQKLDAWDVPIPQQDLPAGELFTAGAIALGIPELLTQAIAATASGQCWTNTTPWVVAFADRAKACAADVKLALNLTVRPTMSPSAIVGMVLNAIGLKTVNQRATTGDRVRHYRLDRDTLQWVREVLKRRACLHFNTSYEYRPHPLHQVLLPGVADGHAIAADLGSPPSRSRLDLGDRGGG